jgi:hypothetical protein
MNYIPEQFEPGAQWSRSKIICPHCGKSRKADSCDGDGNESPTEEDCERCGKVFLRWAYIDVTYNTKAKQ